MIRGLRRRLAAVSREEWAERALQSALRHVPIVARPIVPVWPHPIESTDLGPLAVLGHAVKDRTAWWTDPRSGKPHPRFWRLAEHDPKPLWTLHTLRHLVSAPVEIAAHEAAAWLRENPVGRGPGWEESPTVATRVASLIWLGQRVDVPGLPEALGEHRSWLRRFPSTGSSEGNHAVAEAAALVLLGDRSESLGRLLDKLILPDGGGAEASIRYLAITVEWALFAHAVRPLADLAPVSRAATFLSHLLPNAPKIGDDDSGSVLLDEADYVLSVAGAAAIVTGQLPPHGWRMDRRARMLGLADPGNRAEANSGHFPFVGLTVLRSTRCRVVFDHGPLGLAPIRAHGHADALAIWLSLDGLRLFDSLGSSTYRGPLRDLQRGAWGQSTARIQGREPLRPDGPFGWAGDLVVHDVLSESTTAAASIGTWRRSVTLDHFGAEIVDTGAEPLEIAFWLGAGLECDRVGTVRNANGRVAQVTTDAPLRVERHSGVAAVSYGIERDAVRLVVQAPAGRHRTRIVPA